MGENEVELEKELIQKFGSKRDNIDRSGRNYGRDQEEDDPDTAFVAGEYKYGKNSSDESSGEEDNEIINEEDEEYKKKIKKRERKNKKRDKEAEQNLENIANKHEHTSINIPKF